MEEKKDSSMKEKPKAGEKNCRCEEVSKKSFLELLKLMLNDLAFWKKKNKSG